MRIGLNLLHALPEIGGAWNYIVSLVAALGEWDDKNSYVAFVTRHSEHLVPRHPNFTLVSVDLHSEIRANRILYENTLLQRQARQHRLDGMHWFANTQALCNTVPGAVTIYDLMVFAKPYAFHWLKRLYLQALIPLTAHRARVLLPMSQSTAHDLTRIAKVSESRMVVIPPVLNNQFTIAPLTEISLLKKTYALPDQFWLYVAHFHPHKNHVRLLQAYQHLKSEGYIPWPLVLCGDLKGSDELIISTIADLGLEHDVTLMSAGPPKATPFPRLGSSELPALYSAATAQIFPTLFEGAGIPVLEAMACGCPLTVAAIPSVMEFAGEAATYFDPLSIREISQAIVTFESQPAIRLHCRELGIRQAAHYRAENIVKKLLNAYHQALSRNNP